MHVRARGAVPSRAVNPLQSRDLFVGRDRELDRLDGLVATGVSLITITGTAGVGKTRLAVEFARPPRRLLAHASLSAARSVDDLCERVAEALGVQLATVRAADAVQQIGCALAARAPKRDRTGPIVVLDSFDRLVEAGAEALRDWASLAPNVTLIVTS